MPDTPPAPASADAAGSPLAGDLLHAPSSALRAAGLDEAVRSSSAAATAACLLVEMKPLAGTASSPWQQAPLRAWLSHKAGQHYTRLVNIPGTQRSAVHWQQLREPHQASAPPRVAAAHAVLVQQWRRSMGMLPLGAYHVSPGG